MIDADTGTVYKWRVTLSSIIVASVRGGFVLISRQFLFRETDIGRPKSSTAAGAVSAMNPSLRIKPYEAKCGQETEELFSDDFYSGLSVSNINTAGTMLGFDVIAA